MPIGPFGEILGTTGTLDSLGEGASSKYKSKVIAPRNPKLVRDGEIEFKMRPSQYMFQMNMNTEQKLANMHTMNLPRKTQLLDMADTTHQKISAINIDEPMFQPFPSEIFFQNFEPFETYEVPLVLRNNDKVPRLVKVSQADSPYFKIVSPHNVGHKVGPGLPTTFKLQFTPEEKKDYTHEMVCVTDREKFVVPVHAIGARAVLDFPDEVNFPPAPVKYASSKVLLVRNVGNHDAKFNLSTDKPFSVSPENGVLAVNDSMQVTVEFNPYTVGDHNCELRVHFDTGEDIYISLYGAAQDALVRLDKNSIRIENTFISMANQRTITICNRSNVIGHFRWTQYATTEEENHQKMMFMDGMRGEHGNEKDRFLEECIADPSLRDKMSILSRTFRNRQKLVQNDKMLFEHDVFHIEPTEGDIWPNSTMEVNIIFKPTEAKSYTCTAFCDITGRESRLPLRIRGDGAGPKVQLSFDELDMGNIFVNSTHTYEIILANKGDIDAIFNVQSSNTVFGPKFTFNPTEGIVMPDGHQAIQVTFQSPLLGNFREEFYVQIDGSPYKLPLTFIGSVIGPTFHFDIPKLKFGTVSYGFVNSQSCRLVNTALVPMTFQLRVPGDGVGDRITSLSDFDSNMSELGSSLPLKEFDIQPNHGVIPPQSEQMIQVDFCSNALKKYDLSLVVDVEGVGQEILALPITAKCIVPTVTEVTPILDYGRCFLRHPYEHSVKLHNDTDLPAKYELVPQHVDEYTPIIYSSPRPKGILEARTTTDIPLVIIPQGLEELEIMAQFSIFGSPDPPLGVHVTCIGEGPVVHITPSQLDWGQIPVLTDMVKVIRLANESLIPAKFTAHMVRPSSVWRVEPDQGEIPPEEIIEVTVTAHLDDCVRFQDKVQVNFFDGPSRMVPVMAYGHGTTIVTDPPMTPALHLGPHFSKGPCKRVFTLTNKGRRHQSLMWSSEGFSFLNKPKPPRGLHPIDSKDVKFKNMPPPPEQPRPIFQLSPHRMELNPGDSVDVTLEGQVDNPRVVHEKMLCHAIIGRSGGKELIMKVGMHCEFISPLLQFSTNKVTFRVDKQPEDELYVRTEELVVTNVSSLPLTACLSLKHPFMLQMMDGRQLDNTELELGLGESYPLVIQFDPAYKTDRHSRTVDELLTVTYKEHPHMDQIALHGEVHFPNLEFEKNTIDFGCILNDTEVTRYLNITNNSPMEVRYKWSFLIEDGPMTFYHKRNVAVEAPVAPEETGDESAEEPAEEPRLVELEIQASSPPLSNRGEEISEKQALILEDMENDTEKTDAEKPVPTEHDDFNVPEGTVIDTMADIAEDPNPADNLSLDSRPASQLGTPRPAPAINPVLAALLQQDRQRTPLGVEEIFDILPLYGALKPGDTEQVTLTFFGHADIGSKAKAICEVEGGPTYEVVLNGEASLLQYRIDCSHIDYGKQMYDQIAVAEIVLMNTGRVGFEFTALGMDPGMASKPKPGVPVMIPHAGYIDAHSSQVLTVKFLPGVPEKFHRSFQLQVAHFEPDTIHLFGEGVFPRISLDLPRIAEGDAHLDELLNKARESLLAERRERERPNSAVSGQDGRHEDLQVDSQPSELEVQMEVERLVVSEFADEQHQQTSRQVDVLQVHGGSPAAPTSAPTSSQRKPRRKQKQKARLPEYLLDFGHVVLGTVRTHVVRATNTGWFPASFAVDKDHLGRHGFTVELDRVKHLPGAPDHETVDFVVSFDPRGANLSLGEEETVIPINIMGGPVVVIRVKANVTMPDMQISTDVLDFSEVNCGECKVIMVQLHNHRHVRCHWNSLPTEAEKNKLDKHVPMHLRRKARQERQKPRNFEMIPATGSLLPGQRVNVQVKFMPTEEKFYEQRLAVRLSQSSQRIMLLCRGQGLEPHVEFDRNLIEFGPVLPHSSGDEQDIVVRNPCFFPIEIYNLEFDRAYLEEEKILRLMKGYDEYNTLLLPPRGPGDKLPKELLDYYDEQLKKLEEAETARREAEKAEQARLEQENREGAETGDNLEDGKEGSEHASKTENITVPTVTTTAPSRASEEPEVKTEVDTATKDKTTTGDKTGTEEKTELDLAGGEVTEKAKDAASSVGVGDLEITPVSAAIARHLGIDLTPEGKAARNRRGIAVIVHGTPQSGKSSTALNIAKRYEAALLTVDNIVTEAIANGNTPGGLRARELCAEAARRKAEELKALEGEEGEKKAAGGLSVEAVTAHTQGTGQVAMAQSVAQSLVSNRKTSTLSDQKSKGDKHHGSTMGAKTAILGTSSGEAASQIPSSPQPLVAPIARRLSLSASVAGEEGLLSTVLPEDVLVDILAERLMEHNLTLAVLSPEYSGKLKSISYLLVPCRHSSPGHQQLNDCHRGVVIDGLETLFSQNLFTCARAVLKAFNNRKYIYLVTLKLDYNLLKEQERKAGEERERLAKVQEEEERQRLEEMSEDEYDGLTEVEKAQVDRKRLEVKKERLRKEMEEKRIERERRDRVAQEEQLRKAEEEKALEEERTSKKSKKRPDGKDPKDGKKSQAAGKATDAKSTDRMGQLKSQEGKKVHGESEHTVGKSASGTERPESHATERGESALEEGKGKKGKSEKGSKDGKRPISNDPSKGDRDKESDEQQQMREEEMYLIQRFRTFEHTFKDISELAERWERATLCVRPVTPSEGQGENQEEQSHNHPPSGKKGKKGADKKESSKAAKEAAAKEAEQAKQPSNEKAAKEVETGEPAEVDPTPEIILTEEEKKEKRLEDGIGVPHLMVECALEKEKGQEELEKALAVGQEASRLPSIEEVLDGLGLGPHGPPIPPPATFAVVPYPVKRHAPPGGEGGHYVYVASSPDDPNIAMEEKPSEPEPDEEKSATPEGRKDDPTPTKTNKGKDRSVDRKDKRKSSAKSRGRRGSATQSPPPGASTPASEADGSVITTDMALTEPKSAKLGFFRWIIPAQGEIVIRLRFQSEELGQFDQTLNFEILGTRRRYQLYCRGICAFPTISREPRIVFPHRKKNKATDEIVHKKYILMAETFEFGPLLVGKSRDKFKEGKFPENMEKLTVLNTSPLEADISFCFLNDSKAETYLLDPPAMVLKPGEQQYLTVWAYPKVPGVYEDALVCCVKENPEPIVFKLLCHGVRPELELDRKVLHFDKVLLHRKDTKTLFLRNTTLLPVAWRLNGLENLGDDFSVSQESGIIKPRSEDGLKFYFRAMKAVTTNKKSVRLEVSDVDNIMGLVQTENIQVHAEAYDVALDMSFPKGADGGGIDFDVIRVSDEHKQQCSLKNRGKYEIGYLFSFEPTDSCPKDVCDLFTVVPNHGTLGPVDRPQQVQVIFKSNREVTIRDQPILRCQVIEPSMSETGETIASIPIKVSVRSVFSKYNIFPVNDINFGAMLVNSKKTRTFTIENKGDRFEFKYTISKLVKETHQPAQARGRGGKGEKRTKSRDGSSSGRSVARPKRAESYRGSGGKKTSPRQDPEPEPPEKPVTKKRPEMGGGANQSRLVLGMFSIFPAFGYILPGGHQTITIDCVAEAPGRSEEDIAIDVTGRDPVDNPTGIPYRLVAEACVPSINVADIGAIFEEHRIVKNLSVWQHSQQMDGGGVYGEEEGRFVFNNVLVGVRARARIKISNTNKVPCDVLFSMKPLMTKHSSKSSDVFEVEPARAQIPNHSYIYVTISFTPSSMQQFNAQFEAAIDGIPPNQAKGRNLTFEVCGEGNLPRIAIMKPSVRNKKGQPLLLFRRILVGRSQQLPLLIANDGTLPSKVDIDMADPDAAFQLLPTGSTQAVIAETDIDKEGKKRPHTASVIINVGETATFNVSFQPQVAQRSVAHIRLTVVNNQYEDSVIQMIGEGYQDDITLDNIHNVPVEIDPEQQEGSMAEEDVQAAKSNHIKFGDCNILEPKTLTFSMTNHSSTDCVRFLWPEHPQLQFSPAVGHLHPGRTKDMSITFNTNQSRTFTEQEVPCKIMKITFDKPLHQVSDWDDRLRTVKWIDLAPPSSVTEGSLGAGAKPATPLLTVPGASATARPAKKKVVETEPEPSYSEVSESARTVDLLVSANADHTKVKCKTESIHFRDTLMFQTRVYEFQLSNKGTVSLDYNWQVVMDTFASPGPRSVTFAESPDSRPPTAAGLVVRPGSAAMSIMSDTAYTPLSIEPESGSIAAGKKGTFTVRFSPLDVQEYEARLICSIANLEDGKQGPVIGVRGRSLMPYCHFELEDSDYITSARRNPELRGPGGAPPGTTLDPNTRVMEFNNIGVNVRNNRKFFIVNPTSNRYSFMWLNKDELSAKQLPDFNCLQPEGEIRSGKKTEVCFEFVSSQLGLVESFWCFVIPELNISVPFLLVGHAQDPNVTMDRSHLNFKSLLIGHEAMELVHIENNEDVSFPFHIAESSCHSPGMGVSLRVKPLSGLLPPKSKTPLEVYFVPNTDKEVNFNLVCDIKRKTLPLSLNVKAEGYSMDCMLLLEDASGNKVELSDRTVNQVHFGEVEVNEKAIQNLFVVNSGKFNFDYEWEMNERSARKEKMVAITPAAGAVAYGDRQKCQLAFCPPVRTTLRACEMTLRISNGPTYQLNISGTGIPPGLHFSFQTHNFGPCFIHRVGMPLHTKTLQITNKDRKEISVECLYTPTSHLTHDFEAQVIPPSQTVTVTFTFYPREAIRYQEAVVFEINGLSKQTVNFTGQGTEMKVEVADSRHKHMKLGALRVGHTVKRIVPVVNHSPAPITFTLAITPSLSSLQDPAVLRLAPTKEITLQPRGGTAKVEVIFSPQSRIPQFTEEVLLECAGLFQPLFVVTGSCQGAEICLDTDAFPFGAVVQKSSSTRKLIMTNTGDIGAKFRWNVKRFAPDFSITPTSGYISPGMEVPFEITFHPEEINQDIRYENLECYIEGWDTLHLTLTGMCIAVPPVKEVIHFSAHVRQRETRNLMVPNRTNQLWQLRPCIDGEYWTGPEMLLVEPQQTKGYELHYKPLTMTFEGRKHTGTVFFPLPDGSGLLYNVTGTADQPKPNAKMARDVPCKTSYTEMLTVSNWLKKPQRFRVKTEMIRPEKLDAGTTIKGLDYIDVPGNAKRDYKLAFYAHKEGTSQLKLVFTNEQTAEYQYYELTFRALRPGVISVVDLVTPVRQSVPHTIMLENPLSYAVTFNATCNVPEVLMPNQLSVPAQSEGAFNIEYLPLKVGETQGRLEFNCNDLGLYMYDLNLQATEGGPERALYFRSCLGSSHILVAKFNNFAKQKTDYTCKVDSPDFHVDKSVAAAPGSSSGTEVAVEVTYEPSHIGETRATLTVSSSLGGDYIFPLFGTAIAPKPQGPFTVKSGSTTSITFRNVFSHTTAFTFQVDNPLFHVAKPGENIRSRKDHRIVVGFDGNDSSSKAAVMGKLMVSCARSAGGQTNAQWVYYLKGVTPDAK